MSRLWMQDGKLVTENGSVLLCEDCPCIDSSSTGTGTGTGTGTAGYFTPLLTCVEECRGDGLWPVTLYADISHVGAGHDIDEQTVELTLELNSTGQVRWRGDLDCGDPVIFYITTGGTLATSCDRGPDEVGNCRVFFGFTDSVDSGWRWGICHNKIGDALGNYLVGSAFITGPASASCDPIAFEYESIDPQGADLQCCEPGTCASQEYDVLVRA